MKLTLEEIRCQVDQLILNTPSGPIRNSLTVANIALMAAEAREDISDKGDIE